MVATGKQTANGTCGLAAHVALLLQSLWDVQHVSHDVICSSVSNMSIYDSIATGVAVGPTSNVGCVETAPGFVAQMCAAASVALRGAFSGSTICAAASATHCHISCQNNSRTAAYKTLLPLAVLRTVVEPWRWRVVKCGVGIDPVHELALFNELLE